MATASQLFGGCLIVSGLLQIPLSERSPWQSFKIANSSLDDRDTIHRRMARAASVAFNYMSVFMSLVAKVVMAFHMMTVGARIGFFPSALGAVKIAAPYATVALACLTAAALSSIYGNNDEFLSSSTDSSIFSIADKSNREGYNF